MTTEALTEMENILKRESWGCLGLTDGQEIYVLPINHAYVSGRLLFHCAFKGRKLDCIRANPNVGFTVATQSGEIGDHGTKTPCHTDCESVICFGTARIVEDLSQRANVLNAFNRAFKPDAEDLPEKRIAGCLAFEITINRMSGRRETNHTCTTWEHTFTQA